MNRVAITGFGCVTPFGIGVDRFKDGLMKGLSGTKRLSLFEPDELITCTVVAEVPNFNHEDYIDNAIDRKRLSRVVPMTWFAVEEALKMAKIDFKNLDIDELRNIDVIIGSAGGGIEFAERQYFYYFTGNVKEANPYAIPSSIVGMLPSEISIRFGFRGMSHAISNGCTSSTDAIGYAYHLIKSGRSKIIITGGADACITRGILAGYCLIKAVPTKFNDRPEKASRPFNIDRDGFVLGEGAWILILENYDWAISRGVKPIAEVIGYASTCDAYHRVQIKADGIEPARAVKLALEDAGLKPEDIDYVNLHGTSTKLNDRLETLAMKIALGKRAYQIPMSATKSMIGHPQGACGAAGVVATLISMQNSFIHPTINYENPDPECDLNYVPNKAIKADINIAICNCIGFGSKNSTLVIKNNKEE